MKTIGVHGNRMRDTKTDSKTFRRSSWADQITDGTEMRTQSLPRDTCPDLSRIMNK